MNKRKRGERIYVVRGEGHGRAKVTAYQVRNIRRQRVDGMTLLALACEYDLSCSTVWRIVNRETWRHL